MIRFGTSGWRAVIADGFTIASVRRVATAIALHLQRAGTARKGVFIGHDTRFMSARFAREAAEVLAAHGIAVTLSPGPIPTPAVAYAVIRGRRAGGINITASHNPPEYNGLKFSIASGAPAPPDVTRAIEAILEREPAAAPPSAPTPAKPARITTRDTRADYFRQIARLVRLPAIRRARLQIGCDLRHGASIGYLDTLLGRVARRVEVIRGTPHPEFGGVGPDCGEKQLKDLASLVRRRRMHLGIATDGDGDRFGIVDAGGGFIQPNLFLALLADYLIEERRMRGGVGRTVATTHLIDAVCAHHGRRVFETPVGFKHVGEHLTAGRAFLACEESAGLSLAGHVPEKDGILAGLLAAEMVAVRRRPLRTQIQELFRKVGPLVSRRLDYHMEPAARDRFLRRLEEIPSRFAGHPVARLDTTDGRKMIFTDGSWILFRPSGTEPVVRCYLEARTPKDLDALTGAAREWMV